MGQLNLKKVQQEFLESMAAKVEPPSLKANGHWEVYQEAIEGRLISSLEEDYPQTLRLMENPDIFLRMYVAQYPSNFWTLAEYGTHVPAFIETQFPKNQVLQLVAKKEWAHWKAKCIGKESADLKPLQIPVENFGLIFNPSLQIIEDNKNLHLIFEHEGSTVELLEKGSWKHLIEESIKGKSFDSISQEFDVNPEEIIAIIGNWSSWGLILGFSSSGSELDLA